MGALFCTVPSNLNSGVSEGRNASLYNPEGGSIGEMFSFSNNRTLNGNSWLAYALHTHPISDLPKGPVSAGSTCSLFQSATRVLVIRNGRYLLQTGRL